MAASQPREAYKVDRAAALAGVPRSTVYYWAHHGVWTPSVSSNKTRLWSLADVLALRAIYWLRSKKEPPSAERGLLIPRTTMREVRKAMGLLLAEGLDLTKSALLVDLQGRVLVRWRDSTLAHLSGQIVSDMELDVLREFQVDQGLIGPNLAEPRPTLRIIPGKLGGEPHVVETRVRTRDIDQLLGAGYRPDEVRDIYPFVSIEAITDSRELEAQLRRNLRPLAA